MKVIFALLAGSYLTAKFMTADRDSIWKYVDMGMVALAFVMVAFLATGCSTPRDFHQMTDQVAEYGASKIVDKKECKILYFYRDADADLMVVTDKKGCTP